MNLTKKIRNLLRYFLSYALSLTLALPFPLMANGQDQGTNQNNNYHQNKTGSILSGAGSILNMGAQIFQKAQNDKNIEAQMAKTKLALTPTKFENDYFPGCLTLPAMSSDVYGLCSGQPRTSAEARAFQAYGAQSALNLKDYQKYSLGQGNKKGMNHGNPCVTERIEAIEGILTDREQLLRSVLNQMNEVKGNIDKQLTAQKDSMKELHGYLHGGPGVESNNTRKYSRMFRQIANDRNCGSFMDPVQVQKFAQTGLKNVEKSVNKIRQGGSDSGSDLVTHLLRNQGNIQSSIKTYADKVSRNISKKGLSSSIDKLSKGDMGIDVGMGLQGSKAIESLLRNQSNTFDEEISDLRTKFDKLGQSDLADAVFKEGEHNFNKKIEQWRNQKQNNCLSKKISTKESNPYNEFVGRLAHENKNIRSKTNIESLQREILNHLNNNKLSIKEKQRLVKKAVSKKGSQKVVIMSYDTHDGNSSQKNWNPADLLGTYIDHCLDEYQRIEENGEGQTLKGIEQEARKIHTEYKRVEKSFPKQVAKSIYDKMVHCKEEGKPIPYSVSSQSCSSKKLNLTDSSFCLGQSVECAKNINSCSQKIEETIVKVNATLQTVASNHNKIVMNLVETQRNLLKGLQTQAQAQAAQFEQLYSKSDFNLPGDMTLPTPEKGFNLEGINGALDVQVYNDEDIMKAFTDKITALEKEVKGQNERIVAEIKSEQDVIMSNYNEEVSKWQQLEQQCMAGVGAYNDAEAQRVAKAQEQQGEDQQALGKYCKAYNTFRMAPGCDEPLDDLSDATDEVTHLINTGNVVDMMGKVKRNCLKFASNNPETNSNTSIVPYPGIVKACSGIAEKDINKFNSLSMYCTNPDQFALDESANKIVSGNWNSIMNADTGQTRGIASINPEDNLKYTKNVAVPECESINNYATDFETIASGLLDVGSNAVNWATHQ